MFRRILAAFRRWLSRRAARRLLAQQPLRGLHVVLLAEWFVMWWDQTVEAGMGPGEPTQWERPEEVDWALDVCKEQLLIRRDVSKDEQAPEEQEWGAPELGHPLVAWDPVPLPELVPPKEWVEIANPRALVSRPKADRPTREAYLQWRTLMDSLGD